MIGLNVAQFTAEVFYQVTYDLDLEEIPLGRHLLLNI